MTLVRFLNFNSYQKIKAEVFPEIQKVEPANQTDFVVFQGLKVKRYNRTCELPISL
jgi:hypothetical protein